MNFNEKLISLRKSKGLSQEELGAQLKVSRQAVSRWERDETMPETDKVIAMADLFGVTVDYLLCRQDKRFLDISDLSEEEAALVCGMVELLKKKDGKK